jgi:hypothetical protein
MIICRYSSIILLNILHKEFLACKPFVNVENEMTPLNMGISGAHHSSSTLIDCLAIINWQLETKVWHVMWHLMLHDKWWGPLQWTWHTNFNAKLSNFFSEGTWDSRCVCTHNKTIIWWLMIVVYFFWNSIFVGWGKRCIVDHHNHNYSCSTMIQGVVGSSQQLGLWFTFFSSIFFVDFMQNWKRTSEPKHGRRIIEG